jgi:transcriptional regulator with XRE-family HTH domain
VTKKGSVPTSTESQLFRRWAASATIGERIRWLLEARGYTQVELASKMGITQSAISNWLTGASRKPNAPSLLRLAAALDANPHWVITGEGDPFQMQIVGKRAEEELIAAFRDMDPQAQAALIAAAHAMKR